MAFPKFKLPSKRFVKHALALIGAAALTAVAAGSNVGKAVINTVVEQLLVSQSPEAQK